MPSNQCNQFFASVTARLSGHPADGAVIAAIYAVLSERGLTVAEARALGLVQNNNRSSAGGGKEAAKPPIVI
jgi:hypothetical protein